MTVTATQTVAPPAGANGDAPASRPSPQEVIGQLRAAIAGGQPWVEALLEAVGRWPLASETVDGVCYHYLLLGEAFDWLALAGRLLEEVDGLASVEEKERLLFEGALPEEMTPERFQALIGPEKHRAHLNYFYGVMVEEALLLAVEDEVRKSRSSVGLPEPPDVTDLACQRIYGASQQELLAAYFAETGKPASDSLTFHELKEFTYWLFKRRVASIDSVKVASDTKKGLECLRRMERHA